MDDGYFHGINKLKKPGFKVIKPPGGQTQINIFEQNHEVKSSPINPCQAERNSSNVFGPADATPVKSNADRNSSSIVFGGPELPAPVNQPSGGAAAAPSPTVVPKKESPSESPKSETKKESPEARSPAAPVNQQAGDSAVPGNPAPADVPKKESPTESPKSDTKKEISGTKSPATPGAPAAAVKQPSGDLAAPVTPSSKPDSKKDSNRRSPETQPPIRSSTKVIAPPGGKSSINLFG